MKHKKTIYFLEVCDHWWSNKKHVWIHCNDERSNNTDCMMLSTMRIFKTKRKAFNHINTIDKRIPCILTKEIISHKRCIVDEWFFASSIKDFKPIFSHPFFEKS